MLAKVFFFATDRSSSETGKCSSYYTNRTLSSQLVLSIEWNHCALYATTGTNGSGRGSSQRGSAHSGTGQGIRPAP